MTLIHSKADRISTHEKVLKRIDTLSREELEARFIWTPSESSADEPVVQSKMDAGKRTLLTMTLLLSSISAGILGLIAAKRWPK